MKGNLKMSESQKSEWTYWTTLLMKRVKNLDDIELVSVPGENYASEPTPLERRIMDHYKGECRVLGKCAKAIGIKYNRMYHLIHNQTKWHAEEKKALTKLLGLTPEERSQFFG